MTNKQLSKLKRLIIASGIAIGGLLGTLEKSNAENNLQYQRPKIDTSIESKLDKCVEAQKRCKKTNRDLRELADGRSRDGFKLRETIRVHKKTIKTLDEQIVGLKAQCNESEKISSPNKSIKPFTTFALELAIVLFSSAVQALKNALTHLKNEDYKKAIKQSFIGIVYLTLGVKVLRSKT